MYDACAAALRALGDTVTPLVILAVSVCLNMAGDIFFVVVLKAGVAGAAIATVLAQVIAFIVCYVYMVKDMSFCGCPAVIYLTVIYCEDT